MKTSLSIALTLLLVLSCSLAYAAQSSAGSAAVETVKAVTGSGDSQDGKSSGGSDGSNSSSNSTEHPYENRDTPDSLQGWGSYLIDFPLYKTGGEWIRLHGLLTALLILVLGIWLAMMAGRLLKKVLMRFKRLPEHIAIALSKTVVYFLVFLVILATVLVAGMPFSIVSLLGAMILIGASLGAKSTIYDYLSGLVLALEQPIRIHDCIEMGSQSGFVEEIRGRYTRVRRFDGIDVLVPNSKFLEENVVNWTLSDSHIRGEFTVGVRYSSDVDQTMDILIKSMHDNEAVLDTPAPSVLFWDFGDSALIFKLFFWITAQNPLEVWSVESKLRRTSFNLLNEAGITVAFPQRDVHLDSTRPVKVAIDSTEQAEETGEEKEKTGQSRPSSSDERRREESEEVAEPERDSPSDDDDDDRK